MEPESKIGKCPRCLVRDDDKTEKELCRCPLCGEFFCKKHIQPKPCYIVNLGQPDRDPDKWRYLNDDGFGHPDANCRYDDYKSNIIEDKTEEKSIEQTKSSEALVTIPIKVEEEKNPLFGTCPRCGCTDSHIIKEYQHKAILKCWNCYLKYEQKKYPPYTYFKLRLQKSRPSPQQSRQENNSAKKAIVAGAIIISLAIILFSGVLNNFSLQDFYPSQTSSSTPTPLPYSTSPPAPSLTPLDSLLVNPKTIHYTYTLRGVSSQIEFTVYGGLYNYLVSAEDSTVSYVFQPPSSEEIRRTVTLRYVNEKTEQSELNNLANIIKQITPNQDDQARIAISLVQNIPYDYDALTIDSVDWKYPYEVLYTNTGVCGQKSILLVCLLRDLGYGCVIFEFPNHAAVGISCPSEYAYYSGYAFVESTSPSIITNCNEDYVGTGKLPSSPSYVIAIQEGKSMDSVSEEYQDNQTLQSLIDMGPVLDEYNYAQWQTLVNKYGLLVS